MNAFLYKSGLLLTLLCTLSVTAAAGPVEEAQARMKERLPQIDALKEAGAIGENIDGYLSPLEDLGPRQAELLKAENADRRVLYEAVASRTGQSVEEVGRQRAVRIARLAESGLWLQRPDGTWYRKP